MGFKALIARLSLLRASARVKPEPLSLPLTLMGKKILVLLPPEQKDLTVIKQILPDLIRLFGDNSVHLLAYPDTQVRSIFPSKGLHIISPSKSVMNWYHLPTREYMEKLSSEKFNYVFDTNLEQNRFAARLLLLFPAAVRFGSSGLGQPYINLEIKTKYLRDRRLIYRSILEVLENISRTDESVPT